MLYKPIVFAAIALDMPPAGQATSIAPRAMVAEQHGKTALPRKPIIA